MMLADTMAVFFVVVGLILTLPALWLTLLGLWPGVVEASCQASSRKLWKSFLVGLPFLVLTVILVGVFSKLPEGIGGMLALAAIAFALLFANIGLSGLVTLVGRRLPSPRDQVRPWLPTLRGGLLMVLSFILPLLGWFLLLPAALVIGYGSFVRGLLALRRQSPPDAVVNVEAPTQVAS
ncbi:MAG: hypothetical protein IPK73_18020 [Candidatus Obscuribacter sp.]|nr:hypothetical protein [Candidatus Obscuribacter sp.]MBK9278475.1 hypothetical protein [Candidatus Obscuribacter sp.]MBL8083501.1 hypothetical protein [Candidatus Obscuribacter sp.]